MTIDIIRDTDTARRGKLFQPRGYVDTITEDITFLDDNVAKIDSDTEANSLAWWLLERLLREVILDFHGTTKSFND